MQGMHVLSRDMLVGVACRWWRTWSVTGSLLTVCQHWLECRVSSWLSADYARWSVSPPTPPPTVMTTVNIRPVRSSRKSTSPEHHTSTCRSTRGHCFTVQVIATYWRGWPLTWKTIILQCYCTVGWVIWPVKSSPKWPIMCRVGR